MRGVCYLCKHEAELSTEHVIPQCLGGTLKASLYCAQCNGRCGHEVDAELARQFGRYATLLCLSRERGTTQPFEVITEDSGLRLRCDGKSLRRADPMVRIEKSESGALVQAEIIARSEKELKELAKSLGGKYNFDPELGFVELIENSPPAAFHEFVLDNELIRRAVAKIAYGLACIRLSKDQVLAAPFDAVRSFILGMHKAALATANFADGDFMVDKQRPLHKIHLRYERDNRLLIGYVALFGTFRYTVLLGEGIASEVEWAGIDYTYNPVTQREVEGNDNFVAPSIGKERALRPKHSRQAVLEALTLGQGVIAAHSQVIEAVYVQESGPH